MMQETKDINYLGHGVEHWMAKLGDPDPLVRRLAIYALAMLGPRAHLAIPALEGLLHDPEGYLRVWAASALLSIDRDHAAGWSAIRAGLRDPLYFVRSLAVWHLGRQAKGNPRSGELIPEIQAHLEDPDPSVRLETTLALRRLQLPASAGRPCTAR